LEKVAGLASERRRKGEVVVLDDRGVRGTRKGW